MSVFTAGIIYNTYEEALDVVIPKITKRGVEEVYFEVEGNGAFKLFKNIYGRFVLCHFNHDYSYIKNHQLTRNKQDLPDALRFLIKRIDS